MTRSTRRRILEAVRGLVNDGAIREASMEAVAARAGVTRITLYRTFGSKRDLLEAFVLHSLADAGLDLVDAAHDRPDVRSAVREVLLANCQTFDRLGSAMPFALELARSDPEMESFIASTYHGRRHRAMERLAGRIITEEAARPGWSRSEIADALLVLSSFESFQTLHRYRSRSITAAAQRLYRQTDAFLLTDNR